MQNNTGKIGANLPPTSKGHSEIPKRRIRKPRKPPEEITPETSDEPRSDSGDFPKHLLARIEDCLRRGIALGYFTREYLVNIHKSNPKVHPDHLKAAVLRQQGLCSFPFYLEVLTDFPLRRNNKRLIVGVDGKRTTEDQRSVYEDICKMFDMLLRPNGKYCQISIPRDLLKTTIATRFMSWLYLSDTIRRKRAPIIMFLCHKQNFAAQNLNLTMKVLGDELIKTLYSDILQSEVCRSTEVRFTLPGAEYSQAIKRRESHFMTGSSEMSFESVHCTYIHVDDWCTWENCATPDLTKQNLEAFNKLDFLNDNSGNFRIVVTNTMHYDDDMNAKFIEHQWGSFICRGAEDVRDDGSRVYYFPENEDYTPEGVERYRNKHDSVSLNGNILMRPSARRQLVQITDKLPDWIDPLKNEHQDPIRHVYITLDPAYSHKRKKQGCLQALLLCINTASGRIYVYDGHLCRNLSPMQTIDRVAVLIHNYNAKELIVETNALQGWIAASIHETLIQRGVDKAVILTTAFSSQDKIDSITAFLEPAIRREKIYINPSLPELINEIYGKSKYLDGMDALSFTRFSRFVDMSDPVAPYKYNEEELYAMSEEDRQRRLQQESGIGSVCPWVD